MKPNLPFNLIATEEEFVKSIEEFNAAKLFDEVAFGIDFDEIGKMPNVFQVGHSIFGNVQRMKARKMD